SAAEGELKRVARVAVLRGGRLDAPRRAEEAAAEFLIADGPALDVEARERAAIVDGEDEIEASAMGHIATEEELFIAAHKISTLVGHAVRDLARAMPPLAVDALALHERDARAELNAPALPHHRVPLARAHDLGLIGGFRVFGEAAEEIVPGGAELLLEHLD